MPGYEYRSFGVPLAYSACAQNIYAYRINHTSEYAQNFYACLKKVSASPYASVCHIMRPYQKRIQPMSNVPLAYVSVFQRMSDIFHTLACASTIRNSVTGPLIDYYFVYTVQRVQKGSISHIFYNGKTMKRKKYGGIWDSKKSRNLRAELYTTYNTK